MAQKLMADMDEPRPQRQPAASPKKLPLFALPEPRNITITAPPSPPLHQRAPAFEALAPAPAMDGPRLWNPDAVAVSAPTTARVDDHAKLAVPLQEAKAFLEESTKGSSKSRGGSRQRMLSTAPPGRTSAPLARSMTGSSSSSAAHSRTSVVQPSLYSSFSASTSSHRPRPSTLNAPSSTNINAMSSQQPLPAFAPHEAPATSSTPAPSADNKIAAWATVSNNVKENAKPAASSTLKDNSPAPTWEDTVKAKQAAMREEARRFADGTKTKTDVSAATLVKKQMQDMTNIQNDRASLPPHLRGSQILSSPNPLHVSDSNGTSEVKPPASPLPPHLAKKAASAKVSESPSSSMFEQFNKIKLEDSGSQAKIPAPSFNGFGAPTPKLSSTTPMKVSTAPSVPHPGPAKTSEAPGKAPTSSFSIPTAPLEVSTSPVKDTAAPAKVSDSRPPVGFGEYAGTDVGNAVDTFVKRVDSPIEKLANGHGPAADSTLATKKTTAHGLADHAAALTTGAADGGDKASSTGAASLEERLASLEAKFLEQEAENLTAKKESLKMAKELQALTLADERRKYLGTDGPRVPFGIMVKLGEFSLMLREGRSKADKSQPTATPSRCRRTPRSAWVSSFAACARMPSSRLARTRASHSTDSS